MILIECQRCGDCCKGSAWLRLLVQEKDVQKWKETKRTDIMEYVCSECLRLVDPGNDKKPWKKEECPFLQTDNGRAQCKIYDVRPIACQTFPMVRCSDPECHQKIHLHHRFWAGKCKAFDQFRKEVESDLAAYLADKNGTQQIRLSDSDSK